MKKILILLFLSSSYLFFAQTDFPVPMAAPRESEPLKTEASFPGGMQMFYQQIGQGIKRKNIKSTHTTSCKLYFDIGKDGIISNVKTEGSNDTFNDEIRRVLVSIKTKWIPATTDGKPVLQKFFVPFKYKIED